MPPDKPKPRCGDRGSARKSSFGQNDKIAGDIRRYNPITQVRRAAQARAYILRRKNVPVIPALPPSHGAAR
jgi:hypothetical protein